MKHSKLLKSYINDQSLLNEMILVRSQKVRLSSSSSYSLVGIFDIEKLIEFKLPFLVFYYGVSKIVKNKNETMYSVYFDENNIYIDQYKKSRSPSDDYNQYVDRSPFSIKQETIYKLLHEVI